ncbi:MAG: Biopolymer transport protein ExbD/TolR [Verrucomicrobia bacterium ADurb.Bin474]|nr:MAG: Biopolymer transport protein ExbD/TolR [Verrucomicrobia bacterium ADurb.Bin474]
MKTDPIKADRRRRDNPDRELDQAEQLALESPLSSPLNLRIRYRTPGAGMDLLPFLDLLFIGLLILILGSKVIFTPGIIVDLPSADERVLSSIPVAEVLTVSERGGNQMFFFRGGIYDYESLKVFVASQKRDDLDEGAVLLLKMKGNLSLQLQTELVSLAKEIGFSRVHVAVDPETSNSHSDLTGI